MAAQSLITDEIRSWIGRETPSWTIEVSRLDVQRFAVATDDLNPLYLDEEKAKQSAYGGLIAPPLFYMAPLTEPKPESELRPDGLPYEGKFPIPPTPLPRLMDGGTDIEFFQPIRVGDVLTGHSQIVDLYQKEGRSGPLIFVVRETTFTNQHGAVVLIEKGASILRQGARMAEGQLYFEDVAVGMALPPMTKTPSNTLLFLYSAITWNPQRIHFDKDYTLSEGYRDIIVHGPLRGAFLSQLLTHWIGEEGTLKKLSYANRDIAYVNEPLTCKGTVTRTWVEHGKGAVECEIWAENAHGTRLTLGQATVIVPLKNTQS